MPLWLSRKKCHYICCKKCFVWIFFLILLFLVLPFWLLFSLLQLIIYVMVAIIVCWWLCHSCHYCLLPSVPSKVTAIELQHRTNIDHLVSSSAWWLPEALLFHFSVYLLRVFLAPRLPYSLCSPSHFVLLLVSFPAFLPGPAAHLVVRLSLTSCAKQSGS